MFRTSNSGDQHVPYIFKEKVPGSSDVPLTVPVVVLVRVGVMYNRKKLHSLHSQTKKRDGSGSTSMIILLTNSDPGGPKSNGVRDFLVFWGF